MKNRMCFLLFKFPLALIFSSWYFYDIFQSLKIIIIIFFFFELCLE